MVQDCTTGSTNLNSGSSQRRRFSGRLLTAAAACALLTAPSQGALAQEDGEGRVTDGLVALYDFSAGTDPATVYDRAGTELGAEVGTGAGTGVAMDLTIADPGHVTWLDGQLRVTSPTVIRSTLPAGAFNKALSGQDALTLEAWVRPEGLYQSGPARIISLSADAYNRNVTLGQDGTALKVRLRTTENNLNGTSPSLDSPACVVRDGLQHITYVIGDGAAKLYVNGVLRVEGAMPGRLDNWNPAYPLILANEKTGARPWLGDLDLVALYGRALGEEEVARNFQAGPDGSGSLEGVALAEPEPAPAPTPQTQDEMAPRTPLQVTDGSWVHLTSKTGALPAPDYAEATMALVGDLDGDGLDDFVLGGRNAPAVVAYLNEGDAAFRKVTIHREMREIEAGGALHDVDRDGDLDVVAGGDFRSNKIWWWANPGAEGLKAGQPWSEYIIKETGGNVHHDMAFGDFDGDGTPEFATWNQNTFNHNDPASRLLIGEIPEDPTAGPWTFATALPIWGEGMDVADVDGDGVVDIIAGGRWISFEEGQGYTVHEIDVARQGGQVAGGDVDGDGDTDVIFNSGDGVGPVALYTNDGTPKDGGWTAKALLDGFNMQQGHSLDLGDLNGDGHLDIFAAEMRLNGGNDDARTWVLINDGTGGFRTTQPAKGVGHHESALGDFDGDGDLDILGKPFNWDTPRIDLWLNNMHAENVAPVLVGPWARHAIDSDRPWRAVFAVPADLDGDGLTDIVTGAWWYRNPGTLGGSWTRNAIGLEGPKPLNNMALVADFDGDGDLDVLGTGGKGADANAALVWASNDGTGTFTLHDVIPPAQGDFLQGATAARFAPGGPLTVVLSWHNGVGGLQFLTVPAEPATTPWTLEMISTASQDEEVSTGDIDGDGDTDILQGSQWQRNNGDGTWTVVSLFEDPGWLPDRNRLADMDGDGDLDAVIAYEAHPDNLVAWYEQPDGNPEGVWTEHVIASMPRQVLSLDVTDMDGDGDMDVVAGEHVPAGPAHGLTLSIFANRDGEGGTWRAVGVWTGDEHHDGTQTADLDNDGDQDILSIGWTHGEVLIYENTSAPAADL